MICYLWTKVALTLGPVLHKVVHPDSHVLGQKTFPKDLGFKFQSFIEGHLCALQDGLLEKRIDLSAEMSDIHFRKF